jgi:hypothetical protein
MLQVKDQAAACPEHTPAQAPQSFQVAGLHCQPDMKVLQLGSINAGHMLNHSVIPEGKLDTAGQDKQTWVVDQTLR